MAYFPFFIDIGQKDGLIVGGGTVALRKIEKLLPYGPHLIVVDPDPSPDLAGLPLTLRRRPFQPSDLEPAPAFVVAATDCRELNQQISTLCQAMGIPVNVVDDPDLCTFYFPALLQRGALSVGISTSGVSPTAAIWLKETLLDLLPENFGDLLDWMAQVRPRLREPYPQERDRARILKQLFHAALAKGEPLTDQELAPYLGGEHP